MIVTAIFEGEVYKAWDAIKVEAKNGVFTIFYGDHGGSGFKVSEIKEDSTLLEFTVGDTVLYDRKKWESVTDAWWDMGNRYSGHFYAKWKGKKNPWEEDIICDCTKESYKELSAVYGEADLVAVYGRYTARWE